PSLASDRRLDVARQGAERGVAAEVGVAAELRLDLERGQVVGERQEGAVARAGLEHQRAGGAAARLAERAVPALVGGEERGGEERVEAAADALARRVPARQRRVVDGPVHGAVVAAVVE